MSVPISVIIPAYNASSSLDRCLDALQASVYRDFECLVVDDGSSDDSPNRAVKKGARVVETAGRKGPAYARNLGARSAAGELLFFIDADVCVQPDTLGHVAAAFQNDPKLDAVIGSYDEDPAESNFLSQYKNLMHCFVHQHGRLSASTFWTGCGAMRRSVFQEAGGFDESYARPCIEDIELGARLIRSGKKIELHRHMMVKHLKRWTFGSLLEADIRDRAIPWTLLMLREHHIPNDLNVNWTQRLCVILAYLALLLAPFYWPLSLVSLALAVMINQEFYRFLARRRGVFFAIRAIPLHLFYYMYAGAAFALACLLHLLHLVVLAKHRA